MLGLVSTATDDGQHGGLPRAEFGFPGPLRDRLVAAILDGSKTSTTSLLLGYESSDERLPTVGDRSVLERFRVMSRIT